MKIHAKRLQWIIAPFAILFALLLLLWITSPLIAKQLLKKPLAQFDLRLSDASRVWVNPFAFELSIQDLSLIQADQTVAELETFRLAIEPLKLFDKKIVISHFIVEGVTIASSWNDSELIIAGLDLNQLNNTSKTPATPSTDDDTSTDFTIELAQATFSDLALDLFINEQVVRYHISQLSIDDVQADSDKQRFSLDLQSAINQSNVLNTQLQAQLTPDHAEFEFAIDLKDINVDLVDLAAIDNLPKLSGTFDNSLKATASVNHQLNTSQLAISQFQLNLNNLAAEYNDLAIQLAQLSIEASADADTRTTKPTDAKINAKTNLYASTLSIKRISNNDMIAELGELEVNENHLQLDAKTGDLAANITSLALSNFGFSQAAQESKLIALKNLHIENIQATETQVHIAKIRIGKLETIVSLDSQGDISELVDLNFNPTISDEDDISATLSSSADGDTKAYGIAIDHLLLEDIADIHFSDHRIEPTLSQHWLVTELDVNTLNSQNLKQAIPYRLSLKNDQYTRVETSGWFQLDPAQVNADIKLKIQELDLQNLSPYINNSLEIGIRSGQLDQNLALLITDNVLNGNSELDIRGLKLGSHKPISAAALANGSAISLNAALTQLQDDKGNMSLDIPINGDIDNPSFGIQSFIQLALKKAAIAKLKSYLINTFVPYAQVVSLANIAGKQIFKLRFEPFYVTLEQQQYSEQQTEFINQLAKLLKDNSDQQLQACGIASKNLENKEQALLLIDQQAKKLKSVLVDQQGIESSRILLCTPIIDDDKDAKSRIKFSFK